MPNPTRSDVHVNRPLTNISTAYIQGTDAFIADKVFPQVPVQKQSDLYFTYDKAPWFRDDVTKRAPSTESAGGGFTIGTDSYRCEKYAFHKDIDDDLLANQDEPLNMERDSTNYVTQQLLLHREIDFASVLWKTSTWTGSSTGADVNASDWGAAVGAGTPIEDIQTQSLAMLKKTGKRPNTLVFTADTYNELRQSPEILSRIVYTQRGVVTTDIMASLFDVDRIFVSYALKDTADEGQTSSLDFVSGTGGGALAWLGYVNPTPSLMQPSAGYVFPWSGLFGGGGYGNRMKRFRMEAINSTRIEGEMAYDIKMVSADCGMLFTGTTT